MSKATNVLIVDDDPDIVEQVALALQAAGYEVSTAASRAEAEELLLTVKPDLAILDVMMETPDAGLVLAHHLQKLHPDTPVILLTSVKATTGVSLQTQSAEMQSWVGAKTVLDKPVRPEQLQAEVGRLVPDHRAGPGKPDH